MKIFSQVFLIIALAANCITSRANAGLTPTTTPTPSCTATPTPNKSVTPLPIWTATPTPVVRYFIVPTKNGTEPNMDIGGMSAQYSYSRDRKLCYVKVLSATPATVTRLQASCTPSTVVDFNAAISGSK